MDPLGSIHSIVQDVIASTGDSQDNVIRGDLQYSGVHSAVLPRKCVYVFILELGVFGQLVVVVNSPMVILVPEAR